MKIDYNTKTFFHPRDNLAFMCEFAKKYSNDINTVISTENDDYPEFDKVALTMHKSNLDELSKVLRKKYVPETEEQYLRPLYFAGIGGDCDDQAIFGLAFAHQCHFPPSKTFLVESSNSKNGFEHIHVAFQLSDNSLYHLDVLPHCKNKSGTPCAKYLAIMPVMSII